MNNSGFEGKKDCRKFKEFKKKNVKKARLYIYIYFLFLFLFLHLRRRFDSLEDRLQKMESWREHGL